MHVNKRLGILLFIMFAVSVMVGASTLYMLYGAAMEENLERLTVTAKSQARLMEAVARFDQINSSDVEGGATAATLGQIRDAHANYMGFGETGEFVLAKLEAGNIVFQMRHRLGGADVTKSVPMSLGGVAEPMRRALSGRSGTMVGLDYRGVTVIAAYEPVAVLDMGIVAKLDLSEVHAPFIRAGSVAAAIAVVLLAIATFVFLRTGNPILAELSHSEESFRGIFETSPDGIMYGNEPGARPLGANQAFLDMIGYSMEELQGKSMRDLTPEKWRKSQAEAVDRLEDTGEPQEYEKEYIRKDGTIFPVNVRVWKRKDEFKGEGRVLARVQDISERKQSEAALIKAMGQAETANQAKSEFLSSMSHELRTPLNAVLGYAQILLLEGEDALKPKQREALKLIMEGGEQLLVLIGMVLELSKIEAGELLLSIEEIDTVRAVSEGVALLQGLADAKGITLTNRFMEEKAPRVRADYSRFKQALNNFLSNAIKYNKPQGGVSIFWEQPSQDMLRVLIKDTGIGIPAAFHAKLFEPFTRDSKINTKIEGTGIGLTITQQVINLMGGSVGFESVEGEGSTFWFDLPLAPEQSRASTWKSTAIDTGWRERANSISGSVLYIEDNPSSLKLMEMTVILTPKVVLSTAVDGRSGLEKAIAEHPALILLDLNLPDMDGFDVMKSLRSNPETKDIPVIAVTARTMPTDLQDAREFGFRDYITKPIDVQEVIRAFAKVLG